MAGRVWHDVCLRGASASRHLGFGGTASVLISRGIRPWLPPGVDRDRGASRRSSAGRTGWVRLEPGWRSLPFEIDVLRAAVALSERRIGLILLEWNTMSQLALGADRRPVADLLAQHGYQPFRPDPQGRLVPVTDPGFGADVFARPAMEDATR